MRSFLVPAAACFLSVLPDVCASAEPPLLIPAEKIYTSPDAPPLSHGSVLVREGRIAGVAGENARVAIPEGTRTSECRGVVTAGFQNSHVHFIEEAFRDAAHKPAADLERALEAMLTRYGVTTAFDIASDQDNTLALRARIEKGEVTGPRILTTGIPLFPVDGIPSYILYLPADMLARMHQPRDAAEARRDVRGNFAKVTDATKIMMETSPAQNRSVELSLDVARAAAEETHARGKLLLAHPQNIAGLRKGLDAGVDIFVHTTPPEDSPWDEALVHRMVAQHVSLIPTFKLWYYELAKEQAPKDVADRLVAGTLEQLRAFKAAGGQILFGTDVGYMQDYDPTDEYLLMAKAGMSATEILASLTTSPAQRWKEDTRRGRVAPGFVADLVVLAGDPADDVRNFTKVRCVFRAGKLIYASKDVP